MPTPMNYDIITAASTAYEGIWLEVFDNPQNKYAMNHDIFTSKMSVQSKTTEAIHHEALHDWERWIGAKKSQVPRIVNKSVTLLKYYKRLSVDRLDLNLDRIGALENIIRTFLGEDVMAVYDKYATEALVSNSGAGPTCYDGTALINASHPRGDSAGNTWSNITTSALSYATLDTALQAFQGWTDTENRPKGTFPDTLMVGPKLRKTAMDVTGADELVPVDNAGALRATSNVVAVGTLPNTYGGGMLRVVINPRLQGTQDDYWYLFNSQARLKAIQGYIYRDPEPFSSTDMDGQRRRDLDTFEFDVEADFVFDAGDPHQVYGGIL